jgi:hypothetical protein
MGTEAGELVPHRGKPPSSHHGLFQLGQRAQCLKKAWSATCLGIQAVVARPTRKWLVSSWRELHHARDVYSLEEHLGAWVSTTEAINPPSHLYAWGSLLFCSSFLSYIFLCNCFADSYICFSSTHPKPHPFLPLLQHLLVLPSVRHGLHSEERASPR